MFVMQAPSFLSQGTSLSRQDSHVHSSRYGNMENLPLQSNNHNHNTHANLCPITALPTAPSAPLCPHRLVDPLIAGYTRRISLAAPPITPWSAPTCRWLVPASLSIAPENRTPKNKSQKPKAKNQKPFLVFILQFLNLRLIAGPAAVYKLAICAPLACFRSSHCSLTTTISLNFFGFQASIFSPPE